MAGKNGGKIIANLIFIIISICLSLIHIQMCIRDRTGDHETGGLTIGFAGTDYDTFLKNFENQKISYAKYDSDYVSGYKENKTDFETVMKDVTELFGLQGPAGTDSETTQQKDSADQHPESDNDGALVMTEYEYGQLKAAYETTMSRTGEEAEFAQDEYCLLYTSRCV